MSTFKPKRSHLVSAYNSHTNYNPNLRHMAHKPQGARPIIPKGVAWAAMPYEDPGDMNLDPTERAWKRYDYERALRLPDHIRQGLEYNMWEADPDYPLLVPRREDFPDGPHYHHAVRDFFIELHSLQMRAREKRKKAHPKVRHYFRSLASKFYNQRAFSDMSILANMYGRPDIGVPLGLAASVGQPTLDYMQLKDIERGIFREARHYDRLPLNVYFEKKSGELVVLTHPIEDDLDMDGAEPVTLLRRYSEFEKYHGSVPSRFAAAAENLRQMARNARTLAQGKLKNIAKETAKTVALTLVEKIVHLAGFTRWTEQVGTWLSEQAISPEHRAQLNAAVQSMMYRRDDPQQNVWMLLGESMNLSPEQTQELANAMPFGDAISFIARKSAEDLAQLEKDGKLEKGAVGNTLMDAFESIANKPLKKESIDALVMADIMPNGAVEGTLDNFQKAQQLGATEEQLLDFQKPQRKIYQNQREQMAAAQIQMMQNAPGPAPLKGTFKPLKERKKGGFRFLSASEGPDRPPRTFSDPRMNQRVTHSLSRDKSEMKQFDKDIERMKKRDAYMVKEYEDAMKRLERGLAAAGGELDRTREPTPAPDPIPDPIPDPSPDPVPDPQMPDADPDPDPDPGPGLTPEGPPEDINEAGSWSQVGWGLLGTAAAIQAPSVINWSVEQGRFVTPETNPELDTVTVGELADTYGRNVTHAFPFAHLATVATADGMTSGRPTTYKGYELDPEFNTKDFMVYHDKGSGTAWFAVGGNRFSAASQNPNYIGQSALEAGMDALALFNLSVFSGDAIMRTPRYFNMAVAVEQFLIKYKNYRHKKVTGHSQGAKMLLHLLESEPEFDDAITWASLFNTPMVTGMSQQRRFRRYLASKRNRLLLGTEFDPIDPNHRLYIENNAFVLGYLDNTQLDATLEKYELYKRSHHLTWPATMHRTTVWGGFWPLWHDIKDPIKYLNIEEGPSGYDPTQDAAFDILSAVGFRGFEKRMNRKTRQFANLYSDMGAVRRKKTIPGKAMVPKKRSFASIIEKQPVQPIKLKQQEFNQQLDSLGPELPVYKQEGGFTVEGEGGFDAGWTKRRMQVGGKSGRGEGQFLTAYEWVEDKDKWFLKERRYWGPEGDSEITPYLPWHERIHPNEEMYGWERFWEGGEHKALKKRIFKYLKNYSWFDVKDGFNNEFKSPMHDQLGRDLVIDRDRKAKIEMSLWQIQSREVLEAIWENLKKGDVRQVGGGTEESVWSSKEQAYIIIDADGTRRRMPSFERVFYPAIMDFLIRRGIAPANVEVKQPGFMANTVDKVNRQARQTINDLGRMAKQGLNKGKKIASGWIIGKFIDKLIAARQDQNRLRGIAGTAQNQAFGGFDNIVLNQNVPHANRIALQTIFDIVNGDVHEMEYETLNDLANLTWINSQRALDLYNFIIHSFNNYNQDPYTRAAGAFENEGLAFIQRMENIMLDRGFEVEEVDRVQRVVNHERWLTGLINTFVANNLPTDMTKWGTIVSSALGVLAPGGDFDPEIPILEPLELPMASNPYPENYQALGKPLPEPTENIGYKKMWNDMAAPPPEQQKPTAPRPAPRPSRDGTFALDQEGITEAMRQEAQGSVRMFSNKVGERMKKIRNRRPIPTSTEEVQEILSEAGVETMDALRETVTESSYSFRGRAKASVQKKMKELQKEASDKLRDFLEVQATNLKDKLQSGKDYVEKKAADAEKKVREKISSSSAGFKPPKPPAPGQTRPSVPRPNPQPAPEVRPSEGGGGGSTWDDDTSPGFTDYLKDKYRGFKKTVEQSSRTSGYQRRKYAGPTVRPEQQKPSAPRPAPRPRSAPRPAPIPDSGGGGGDTWEEPTPGEEEEFDLLREGGTSSLTWGINYAAGEAGAKVGGFYAGPGGAVAGRVLGTTVASKLGSRKLSEWLMGKKGTVPTKKDIDVVMNEKKPSVQDKDPEVEVRGTNVGVALLGISQGLAAMATGLDWENDSRVPHMQVADYRAMMTREQRNFMAQIMASQPGLRGEGTVVGDPRGSLYGYFARMIVTDWDRAQRTLRPLINTNDPAANVRGAELAKELILDFYSLAPKEVFSKATKVAALLTSSYITYKATSALWDKYNKWSKTRKPKPKKPKKSTRSRRRGVRASGRKRLGGTRRSGNERKDSLLKLFKRLDKDKSGRLGLKEITRLARRFKLTPKALMKKFDTSGDNQVSWPEFARYMRKKVNQ